MAIDIKVVVNPIGGSIAAPDARFDVILYYSKVGEDIFTSAPGVYGDVAWTAAYFTRKSVMSSMEGVTFYDYETGKFHDKMTDRRENFSTLFFCGQFATEEEVISFLDKLHYGANNLDIRGKVKLTLDGACQNVIAKVRDTWKRYEEAGTKSII